MWGASAAERSETKGKTMNGCIVVGTDGSDTATKALDAAIELGRAFSQPLHIVAAYRPEHVSMNNLPAEYVDMIQPESRVDAVLAEAESRSQRAGVPSSVYSICGDAAE